MRRVPPEPVPFLAPWSRRLAWMAAGLGLLSIVATRFGGIPPANGLRILGLAILLAVLAAVAAGLAFATICARARRDGAGGPWAGACPAHARRARLDGGRGRAPAGRWRTSRRIRTIRLLLALPVPRSMPAAATCRRASTGIASATLARPMPTSGRSCSMHSPTRRCCWPSAPPPRSAGPSSIPPRPWAGPPPPHRCRGPFAALPLPDDVTIRIRPGVSETRIDVRSASRVLGKHEFRRQCPPHPRLHARDRDARLAAVVRWRAVMDG